MFDRNNTKLKSTQKGKSEGFLETTSFLSEEWYATKIILWLWHCGISRRSCSGQSAIVRIFLMTNFWGHQYVNCYMRSVNNIFVHRNKDPIRESGVHSIDHQNIPQNNVISSIYTWDSYLYTYCSINSHINILNLVAMVNQPKCS